MQFNNLFVLSAALLNCCLPSITDCASSPSCLPCCSVYDVNQFQGHAFSSSYTAYAFCMGLASAAIAVVQLIILGVTKKIGQRLRVVLWILGQVRTTPGLPSSLSLSLFAYLD